MKAANGFTLIELVIVIIILGILSVTAAPKFLNLQDDARKAAAQGVAAAIGSAVQLAHMRAVLEGKDDGQRPPQSLAPPYDSVLVREGGYPWAMGIQYLVTLDGWKMKRVPMTTDNTVEFIPENNSGNSCVVTYTEPNYRTNIPYKVSVAGC